MPAHERAAMLSEGLRQGFAFRRVGNQHVRHPKRFTNIENRQARADQSSHMVDGKQGLAANSHQHNGSSMCMNNRFDVGPNLLILAVNKPFAIESSLFARYRNAT